MNYIAVAIGGFFGAVIRDLIGKIIVANIFPVGTLTINLLGSFFLLFLTTIFLEKVNISDTVRLGITSGFLGAFTTFSTLAKETYVLLTQGKFFVGFGYIVLSLGGGFFTGILGRALALYLANLNINVKDEG
ncbi:chromosome condensation protein CcrB [Carboxydothermus islandicus]|uniref:Fluoride-specific ion channel FluC n=1 Tax=Carboxydothermus islandicus TaxID=661089 RepID=A0A1L8D3N6_9THEO|nr:CrcB family protein [Carboxydothermus islandicus]GAV25779.1 chromosome condensation protein CcrB [Carboxydothermus islandicus]